MVRSAAAMSGRRCSSAEGTPTGTSGSVGIARAARDVEILRILADQHRDGMRVLRARHAEADQVGLRGFQRHLRGDHRRRRCIGEPGLRPAPRVTRSDSV